MIPVEKDGALLSVCPLRNPREDIILVFLALTLNIGLVATREWAADLKEIHYILQDKETLALSSNKWGPNLNRNEWANFCKATYAFVLVSPIHVSGSTFSLSVTLAWSAEL